MNSKMPEPKVIVPTTSRRDLIFAIVAGALLLGFVVYGVKWMAKPHENRNVLVGIIVEKQFTPRKEEQVSFSGRRIEGVKQIEGDFVLKVRVEAENRIFEVPVERPVFDSRTVGDKLEFVRPPSEQR